MRRFPVDELKLDRSFTEELGQSAEADAIPSAIVQLAHGLSLSTVAEGVETVEQQQRLAAMGFQSAQGHLFGPAESVGACAVALRARVRPGTGRGGGSDQAFGPSNGKAAEAPSGGGPAGGRSRVSTGRPGAAG